MSDSISFAIEDHPNAGYRANGGMLVRIVGGGRKVSGTIEASVSVDDDGQPAVYLSLSPSEVDESGAVVYRDADPDADEVQRMSAVAVHPVRVNGLPYGGYRHLYRSQDGRRWITSGGSNLERMDGGSVTETARSVLWRLEDRLADELATPERIHAARVRAAEYALGTAQRKADEAATELAVARARLANLTS